MKMRSRKRATPGSENRIQENSIPLPEPPAPNGSGGEEARTEEIPQFQEEGLSFQPEYWIHSRKAMKARKLLELGLDDIAIELEEMGRLGAS
jgi:hypothetical protein